MRFYDKQGLRYYQFESFQDLPVFHAILTRRGGVSQPPFNSLNTGGTVGDDPQAVLTNHKRIYNAFGYDFSSRFDVWQVHGDKIVCADAPRSLDQPHDRADGILTDKATVTLFMRFADCVPILLVDPLLRVIGIAHAGWQGTYQQVAQRAVEKMTACFGSRPETIFAGIGPSICQRCYEVGPEVLSLYQKHFRGDTRHYFQNKDGKLFLDLWGANQDVLFQAGVKHIEISKICTACNLEDWYSHRGEHGQTGRFAVFMSIRDN
ncbi:MAG: peptidoglycan editing factor PgeF [Chloroflexi bacterium]|jgi:YfiH family protein|nr:peptidoglycan editing factor PgeF [Chloroflexota bacterium]